MHNNDIMMYRWVMVGHVIRAIRLAMRGAIRLAADALGEVAATHKVRLLSLTGHGRELFLKREQRMICLRICVYMILHYDMFT